MKRITHSDNLCTVGWTCINALMTADDMRALLRRCPDGSFTQCFYAGNKTINTPDKAKVYLEKRGWQGHGNFYFNFKEDDRGQALLDELFNGETDEYDRPITAEMFLT